MNKVEARALLLAGSLLSGCQGGQIDGLSLVDCEKGPKNGAITIDAVPGRQILLGSDNLSDRLGTEQSKLRVTSQGNGKFSFNLRFPIQEWTIDPNSSLPDTLGPVILNEDHSVTFKSNGVDMNIKGKSGENGSTELDIRFECANS